MLPLSSMTAIFGGSFNPPHMGHQMAVLYLLEALDFREVWLAPTFVHPLGKQHVSWEHRLAMCYAMVGCFGERVRVLSTEADLVKHGSEGRTIHLVDALQREHPDKKFTLILGSDTREQRHLWHRWDDIEAKVEVLYLARAGFPDPNAAPLALPDVSSTWVRSRLAAGHMPRGLVPSKVLDYIREHGLYC